MGIIDSHSELDLIRVLAKNEFSIESTRIVEPQRWLNICQGNMKITSSVFHVPKVAKRRGCRN